MTPIVALLSPVVAAAQESLTLEQALSRARERASSVVSARARIEEARARFRTASLLLRENPEVDFAAGRPTSAVDRSTEIDVGLMQNLDVGGRRSARIGAARAEVAFAIAESENTLREALRDVAATFFRALHAQERVALAGRAEEIANEILQIARKRYEAGDVALLDVNLARTALTRARTETLAARADLIGGLGELRVLLGLEPGQSVVVAGELRGARRYDLSELLAKAVDRPDIRAIQAELEAARAEFRLGRALAWPEFGLGGRYEREESEGVVLGAVRLTLPLFDRGQGLRAEATARTHRLEVQLETTRRVVRSQVSAAFEAYGQQQAAAEELERNGLPLLAENETLSRESYQAGQISLAELLLVRREILEIRRDYLARLLDVALASTELEASAGVLQ